MVIYAQIGLDHLQNAVLQRLSAKVVVKLDKVVFSTFDIEHIVLILNSLLKSIFGVVVLLDFLTLLVGDHRKVKDLLLGNGDCIWVVEAAQIYMLHGVILVVDLVKDLPGNIKLNLLSHKVYLMTILLLIYGESLILGVHLVLVDLIV